MKIPLWLDAKNDLDRGMVTLPARLPRPNRLISPRTDSELSAWRRQEALKRKKLNDIMVEWLKSRKWPAKLDIANGYLLHLRLHMVSDWLDAGIVATIQEDTKEQLLKTLLIDGWEECFLDHHISELEYRKAEYANGRWDAGDKAWGTSAGS